MLHADDPRRAAHDEPQGTWGSTGRSGSGAPSWLSGRPAGAASTRHEVTCCAGQRSGQQGAVGDGHQDLLPAVDGVEAPRVVATPVQGGRAGARRRFPTRCEAAPAAEDVGPPGRCWAWSPRGDGRAAQPRDRAAKRTKAALGLSRRRPWRCPTAPFDLARSSSVSGVGRFYSVDHALVRKQSS